MPRARALLTLTLLTAAAAFACEQEQAEPVSGLHQVLELKLEAVEFGEEAFVTATRRWNRHFLPDPWPDAPFAGLRARLVKAERRESGEMTSETRVYAVRAFSLAPVLRLELPEWRAMASDGANPITAATAGATLSVLPIVDPASPGSYELPIDLAEEARPVLPFLFAGLILLGGLWLWLRRRRGVQPELVLEAVADPRTELIAALQSLRVELESGVLTDRAFHERLAELLRAGASARGVSGIAALTSEELTLAWERVMEPSHSSEILASLLTECDAVKFARVRTESPERRRALDMATDLLEAAP